MPKGWYPHQPFFMVLISSVGFSCGRGCIKWIFWHRILNQEIRARIVAVEQNQRCLHPTLYILFHQPSDDVATVADFEDILESSRGIREKQTFHRGNVIAYNGSDGLRD